ncbi:amidohydrolase family protein [Candidatus Poriferisocius sp.]|uniref:metal-dependent hydrolase family protein n=1 Tax=Candidatus Poriferisocius sp. TaxID=3101276 RepID=UPI003B592820
MPEPTPILITGGTVIDGTGAPPRPDTAVRLEGDRIVAVGPEAAALAEGVEATVIDATGYTVMPGLIDAHVHCTFDDVQSNDELFFHRDHTLAALIAARNLQKLLLAGVTGFCDPDTLFSMGPSLRDAVDAGVVEGPRMATGVQALVTAVGGTAGRLIPDTGVVGYAQVVSTVDEMIQTTRRHIKHGADWIKIHATGSIPRHQGELLAWKPEELRAVCETAHELETPVMAHARSAGSTQACAEAGVDLVLHASFMDDAALEAVIDAGAALMPTFTFLANLADYGHLVGAGAGMQDVFRGEIEATAKMMAKAHEAGVKLLCGSESGFALTPYGHWHAREMEVLVESVGLSPIEAISCATANGATALRMEGEVGTLMPGMAADVLVVDGDPSTDVTVLGDRTNLRHVISRGLPVDVTRPWPTRRPIPGEKVANWAAQILTSDLVWPGV